MGVYYIIVNDTKKEYIDPADFNENFKLSGIFQGVHGSAIAKLLCSTQSPTTYSYGYWSGDSIRILGDNTQDAEHSAIMGAYKNIGFYALAYEFEESAKHIRDKIMEKAASCTELRQGLDRVNPIVA